MHLRDSLNRRGFDRSRLDRCSLDWCISNDGGRLSRNISDNRLGCWFGNSFRSSLNLSGRFSGRFSCISSKEIQDSLRLDSMCTETVLPVPAASALGFFGGGGGAACGRSVCMKQCTDDILD